MLLIWTNLGFCCLEKSSGLLQKKVEEKQISITKDESRPDRLYPAGNPLRSGINFTLTTQTASLIFSNPKTQNPDL